MSSFDTLTDDVDGQSFFDSLHFSVQNGYADVYTLTSILVKTDAKWYVYRSLAMSVVCMITQLFATLFVFVDTIQTIRGTLDVQFCNSGDWVDRATAMLLCFYLFFFYIQKSWGLWKEILKYVRWVWVKKKKFSFVSQDLYIVGRTMNLNSLVLTTVATVLVLYATKGVLNIILSTFAMHFIHDLPKKLVDTKLHRSALTFLDHIKLDSADGNSDLVKDEPRPKSSMAVVSLSFLCGFLVIVSAIFAFAVVSIGIIILPICKI
jgi:hypothetical protein